LVSVIIPTYYRNDRLETTLERVFSQTYDPIEVIVVDDSGERYAEPVVTTFESVQYIPLEENSGPNVARTRGIRAATGEYIQLLDDDDQLFETKIEKQVARFEGDGDLVVVYSGGVYESGEPFLPSKDARGDVLERALTFDLPACITSSMLIRREPLGEAMPLPDPPGSDDTYLKIELAQRGLFEFVSESLLLKGEEVDARSDSEGAVTGTYDILSTYSDLYDRFPPSVERKARAAAHYREGKFLLRQRPWSVASISMIFRACRKHPGIEPNYWVMLGVSIFGRLGFATQRKLKSLVRR
jgi:glycosyltransferase involved in cell wall biosynthesis